MVFYLRGERKPIITRRLCALGHNKKIQKKIIICDLIGGALNDPSRSAAQTLMLEQYYKCAKEKKKILTKRTGKNNIPFLPCKH